MAPAFEHAPLHAHKHAHTNLASRAELRGSCWNAHAVLGSAQLAPSVRSLRLRSQSHAPHACAHQYHRGPSCVDHVGTLTRYSGLCSSRRMCARCG